MVLAICEISMFMLCYVYIVILIILLSYLCNENTNYSRIKEFWKLALVFSASLQFYLCNTRSQQEFTSRCLIFYGETLQKSPRGKKKKKKLGQ